MGILALFIALGGGAYAASKSSGPVGLDGIVHSCIKIHGGTLRVVKAGRSCRKGEQAVAINQTGHVGASGAPGPVGPAGKTGATGPKGDKGDPGVTNITTGEKNLTLETPGFASIFSIAIPPLAAAGGTVDYTVVATDGNTQIATEHGRLQWNATANSITCTVQADDKLHLGTVNSGCTPGFFNPGSQPGVSIFDNVSFSSPAAIVTHKVYFTIENDSPYSIRLE